MWLSAPQHSDPDYSAAYVVVDTDCGRKGFGLTFTLVRPPHPHTVLHRQGTSGPRHFEPLCCLHSAVLQILFNISPPRKLKTHLFRLHRPAHSWFLHFRVISSWVNELIWSGFAEALLNDCNVLRNLWTVTFIHTIAKRDWAKLFSVLSKWR